MPYKLWRGDLEKGYYKVQIKNAKPVLCWYGADILHSIVDRRTWRVEDNVHIQPVNLENRSVEEEREAKKHVEKLKMTQSIAARVKEKLEAIQDVGSVE